MKPTPAATTAIEARVDAPETPAASEAPRARLVSPETEADKIRRQMHVRRKIKLARRALAAHRR